MEKPKTRGLKEYAHKKKELTTQKVDEAIQRLIKEKARINFNSVSTESGVTKAYLYNNVETRKRIESLREQQRGLPAPGQVKRVMNDASKDVLLAAKNKRIKELEEENRRLKDELARLLGKVYDNI